MLNLVTWAACAVTWFLLTDITAACATKGYSTFSTLYRGMCQFNESDPSSIATIKEFEEYAEKNLDKRIYGYYAAGANHEHTTRRNTEAFSWFRIRPRVLRDVSNRVLMTNAVGQTMNLPVGISPAAFQKMAHPDGEIGMVKAAEEAGTIMILSTLSTTSIEELTKVAPRATKWFQLYLFKDRDLSVELVRRAELSGFKAIVVTVDSPFGGHQVRNVKNQFSMPSRLRLANLVGYMEKHGMMNKTVETGKENFPSNLLDTTLSMEDLMWLRRRCVLPIVAKGVLTGEDAEKIVKYGVSGIMVSNHGGRQLDSVPSTIEALPEIVQAVKGKADVFLDGGVRRGTDVFKALALGAKAVFTARPFIWGLSHSGQRGVKRALEIFRTEVDAAFGLAGVRTVNDIKPEHVVRASYYDRLWATDNSTTAFSRGDERLTMPQGFAEYDVDTAARLMTSIPGWKY